MHLDVFVMGKTSFFLKKKNKNTAKWKQIPGKVQHKVITRQIIASLSKSSTLAILQLT